MLPRPIDLALETVHFWEAFDSRADFKFKGGSQKIGV